MIPTALNKPQEETLVAVNDVTVVDTMSVVTKDNDQLEMLRILQEI